MSHHYTTRNPMSEARRQHVHGRLMPKEHPRVARPEGEISLAAGGALLCALALVATLLAVALA